ncbi:helix-turn-helix domain-containing protein [Plantactinospora soyae]|uniref:Transcriptional regulator with XRE-family HTH domain n=1 Tax=Plantactinospora soyae TaxID=1544732 RepID=A0A927MG02_9ACTN|nr:helix-turn-helix transcriptional regulator [Plantactinospora soyae]MBE1492396.1 transcriptional regulator with XRE-family HTH domain [Plantactinospora soyae]
MAQIPSPTIRARRLRRELRRLRDRAGLIAEDVATDLGWHRTKVIRIEQGHSRVTQDDVRDLVTLYKATDEEQESLAALARQARQKGWWNAYGDVLPDAYVGFEAEASSISSYESLLVPGLLQTEEYIRASIQAGRATADEDESDRIVAARLARKALLSRDVPPKLWVVLDEAVVRRMVGGPSVMRAQVARLIEACANPSVVLQVLPFSAGAHAAMSGPFTVLGYDDELLDPTLVYIENDTSTLLLDKEPQVARYRLMFDHLRAKALDPDHSGEFLARVMDDYPK